MLLVVVVVVVVVMSIFCAEVVYVGVGSADHIAACGADDTHQVHQNGRGIPHGRLLILAGRLDPIQDPHWISPCLEENARKLSTILPRAVNIHQLVPIH